MLQMHHSGMLSQAAGSLNGGDVQGAAGSLMGRAMNVGGAIGTPLMQGGMMLAGIDPMTMALRAGWAARGAGVAGMGAAGMAAGGAVALPMMAAQYAGTQVFRGAQQQQVLNQQLSSTYQFANQYGGRGFTSGEMGDIGQSMRVMSQQRGPGGEFVTMDEMGRLASNMGRMGMAQGVRGAKEFNDKFQEMMKTVKTIAEQMSTSLESAQQIMASMRGSGIFQKASQVRMSAAIREGAAAGGLATEELSQMANIGSHVSRAIGGRGKAGAFAGVEAITRVGAAQRSGVLSEEDVYNATGETGAAGRQAYAAMMVQGDAQFFKGGLGRRVLASIAGKGGQINEEDVEEYIHGRVGTGDTMRMAHRNLGKVGRADFIRNEGRLRGEALKAFGGMGRAVVAKQWLEGRGYDLDTVNTDDRAMLFFQRRFNMDADQAESLLKMTRSMGTIQAQRSAGSEQEQLLRGLEQQRKNQGLEGIKRKFEDTRKKLNDSLQQVGADFYREGQNTIEGFINKLTGQFVATVDRDLGQAAHTARQGSQVGQDVLARRFGINVGGRGKDDVSFGTGLFAGAGETGPRSDVRRFLALNKKGFAEAGYNIGNVSSQAALDERLRGIAGIEEGMTETDSVAMGIGAGLRTDVLRQSANLQGRGSDRLRNFGSVLKDLADSDRSGAAAGLRERYDLAGDKERARIMASVMRGAGADEGMEQMAAPEERGMFGGTAFGTIADRHEAIGRYALTGRGSKGTEFRRSRVEMVGRATDLFGGVGALLGAGKLVRSLASSAYGLSSPDPFVQEAMGRAFDSEEGRDLIEGVSSSDADVRNDSFAKAAARSQQLLQRKDMQGGNLSRGDEGELRMNQSAMMTHDLLNLAREHGVSSVDELPDDVLEKAAKRYKDPATGKPLSADQFRRQAVTGPQLKAIKQREARSVYFRGTRARAKDTVQALKRGGVLTAQGIDQHFDISLQDVGKTTSVTEGGMTRDVSQGQLALQSYVRAQEARSRMGIGTGAESDERNMALEREAQEGMQATRKALAGMSVEDARAFAQATRGKEGTSDVRQLALSIGATKERVLKGEKRGGQAGIIAAIGGMLGADIDVKSLKGKSAEEMALALEDQLTGGLSAESFADQNKLRDIDSRIRLETDDKVKAKLVEEREGIVRGGQGQLDDIRKSTGRVKDLLAQLKDSDPSNDEAARAALTEEAQGLSQAGISAKKRDAAAEANDPQYVKMNEVAQNTKDMVTAIKQLPTAIGEAVKSTSPDGPGGSK